MLGSGTSGIDVNSGFMDTFGSLIVRGRARHEARQRHAVPQWKRQHLRGSIAISGGTLGMAATTPARPTA